MRTSSYGCRRTSADGGWYLGSVCLLHSRIYNSALPVVKSTCAMWRKSFFYAISCWRAKRARCMGTLRRLFVCFCLEVGPASPTPVAFNRGLDWATKAVSLPVANAFVFAALIYLLCHDLQRMGLWRALLSPSFSTWFCRFWALQFWTFWR